MEIARPILDPRLLLFIWVIWDTSDLFVEQKTLSMCFVTKTRILFVYIDDISGSLTSNLGGKGLSYALTTFMQGVQPPLSISVSRWNSAEVFESKNVYSTYSPSPSTHAWSLCNHSWNAAIRVSSGMSARIRTIPSRSSSAIWNSVPWSSLGSRADVVHFSGCYPRDIAWLFWRRVAWHCRPIPLMSDDLLHHEERIFREECDQYNIDWSTSVLSAGEIPNGIHVDSTPLSALFSDCWSFVVELLAGLPGLRARFIRVDSRNKTRLHPGLQDISSPGAGLNPTDPKDVFM
jgi:hypothetical protein